jgi:hypothetical protein
MMDAKRYLRGVLDTDLSHDILFVASQAEEATLDGSDVTFTVSFQNTRLLAEAPGVTIRFDESYPGFEASPLKKWIDL